MAIEKDILPIAMPGYSLTQPKDKQYPWHSTPLITDLEEANNYANVKMTEPDTLKYIQGFLQQGMPVTSLGEIITKDLAFDGAFNFDVAELVKPLITMQLIQIGAYSGIDVNLENNVPVDQVDLDLENKKNVDKAAKEAYNMRVKNIQDNIDKNMAVKEDTVEDKPVKGLMSKNVDIDNTEKE